MSNSSRSIESGITISPAWSDGIKIVSNRRPVSSKILIGIIKLKKSPTTLQGIPKSGVSYYTPARITGDNSGSPVHPFFLSPVQFFGRKKYFTYFLLIGYFSYLFPIRRSGEIKKATSAAKSKNRQGAFESMRSLWLFFFENDGTLQGIPCNRQHYVFIIAY